MKTGLEQISEERIKQISELGYTLYQKAQHKELLEAAYSYLAANIFDADTGKRSWPWDKDTFKPGDYKENLRKAGALIAAELDRLNIS